MPASAQYSRPAIGEHRQDPDWLPPEMEAAKVVDRTGDTADIDARFVDERARPVTLRDIMASGRPVILTLNYFRCPMLCGATLNGLVDGLEEVDLAPGQDFDIVTVSFAATEGPDLAAAKKEAYLTRYRHDGAAEGWHFLTGTEEQIRRLTDSVGFGFHLDPKSGEYAHSATIIFLTPQGRISKYMNDVLFQPRDLRLAIVEASQGRVGSRLDRFMLFTCFTYDPHANSYTLSALKLMRFGGFLTVLALSFGLLLLRLRGPRREDLDRTLGHAGTGS